MSGIHQALLATKSPGSNISLVGAATNVVGAATNSAGLSLVNLTNQLALLAYVENSGSVVKVVAMSTNHTSVVTAGAPVTLLSGATRAVTSIARIDDTTAIVAYRDSSDYIQFMVVTVTGTAITTYTALASVLRANNRHKVVSLTATTALVTWDDFSTSQIGMAVISVSGTTCTAGAITSTVETNPTSMELQALSATEAMLVYKLGASNLKGSVITVAGTVATNGTIYDSGIASTDATSILITPTGVIVVGAVNKPGLPSTFTSNVVAAIRSGSVITWGSLVLLNAATSRDKTLICSMFDKYFMTWNEDNGNDKFLMAGVVSTSIASVGTLYDTNFSGNGGLMVSLDSSTILIVYGTGASLIDARVIFT